MDDFGPGFFNSNEVSKLVEDCRKYNFNAVIVEMRARGDASYFPRPPNHDVRRTFIDKTPEDFDPNYDALADIIRQCHTGTPRIEVHCWVVAQFIWAGENPPKLKNHVYNLHPEYLTKDSVGQTFIQKGYFLDPGNPDACRWNHDVGMDIVSRYDIDGFHWDYLRYPNQDSGYNDVALARYNAEFGLTGQPNPRDERFSAWRRRQVTDFLRWVTADMLSLKPNLVISASVFSNYQDAFGYRFQEWVDWADEGLVDILMPMDFSVDSERVFKPRAAFAFANQKNRLIYPGQGAYLNNKENTLAQLNMILERGFAGYCVYSYRTPNVGRVDQANTFEYLKAHCQTNWVETPPLLWKLHPTKGIIKGTVTNRQTGDPVYNAVLSLDSNSTHPQKTEPHGNYAFFEVMPGVHLIHAETPAGTADSKVLVQPGKVFFLDMTVYNK